MINTDRFSMVKNNMWPLINNHYSTYEFLSYASVLVYGIVAYVNSQKLNIDKYAVPILTLLYAVAIISGGKVLWFLKSRSFHGDQLVHFDYNKAGTWGAPLIFLGLVALYAYLISRKSCHSKMALACLSLPLALCVTKLGCLCNGCCYGTTCNYPWAIILTRPRLGPANIPLHPVQIYEMLTLAIVFIALKIIQKHSSIGLLTLWFLFLYSMGRGLTEFWRGDRRMEFHLGPLTGFQVVCFAGALLSVCMAIGIFFNRNYTHERK